LFYEAEFTEPNHPEKLLPQAALYLTVSLPQEGVLGGAE